MLAFLSIPYLHEYISVLHKNHHRDGSRDIVDFMEYVVMFENLSWWGRCGWLHLYSIVGDRYRG